MAVPREYVALTQLGLNEGHSLEIESSSEDTEKNLTFTEWRSTQNQRLEGIVMPLIPPAECFQQVIPRMATKPRPLGPDAVPEMGANLLNNPHRASSHERISERTQTKSMARRADASLPNTPEFMDRDNFQNSASSSDMFSTFLSMSTITDNERKFFEELIPNYNPEERLSEAFLLQHAQYRDGHFRETQVTKWVIWK
ncbi:uncharacterized protein Z519_11010 [Cladophialophora bantiana CBS 173.52]|uniref:Uncharacterized protein n=1 Tax=Cladophialophora bantiana (strain ATCC 10958 / CBS 173.52 / CDC B-1940 / NIH 8579) TaxID=1442370 RepID=A0A0D2EEB1_CLAB1|nr:uncharacterized protein Z519_11010 [Cladophialophora bantiana CBS 173.52]KIW88441.1 hypothetical protein Z519_11010 [Cladophialophora bantiana CBS 173.52]